MLRRKLLIINLVFAFVMLVIVVVGIAIFMLSLDNSDIYTVNVAELNTVELSLNEMTESDIFALKSGAKTPEKLGLLADYELYIVDKAHNVYVDTGLAKDVRQVVVRKAPDAPEGTPCTVYNGVIIMSRGVGGLTVHAVKSTGNILEVLRVNVYIFMAVIIVVLLLVFVGSIVVELHVIFPRLNKLKLAMDEVYNGNYEQTLRLPPAKRGDEITALLVDFDMLRRKLREATLAKEAADRERGIVVSGISHDLRTPLTVIKTHAKGLLDGVAKRVGREGEYVANIYSTALDMENLVAKLADFTKVETHDITYSFVVRDMCEVIQNFVDKHYIPYSVRGLNLKCKLPKGKKLWVNIDKDQFNRVWQNLCDNSLKYKEKQEATVVISAELIDENVVVRVADDGPGIAEYEVEYIFESYYRGDASRTNPTDGSGLGLAIVKNCVMAHNGQIQAYNNHGLTIEIILPYRRKK
jgi:signal transduction histidine kinase